VAAPVVGAIAVTVGLGALAVAGTASLEWNASHDISNHNWAGVAYDAGSLVGGLAAGIAGGPTVATAIDPGATPGWSPQSWSAQAFDSSKGSRGDWMGSGPTHASAGVSTGGGGWLSSVFGGRVSLIMLLILPAIISSTTLLVGAISAVQEQHFTGHGFIAVILALILGALNFFSVRRAALGMAAITREKPEALQARYGEVFSFAILIWAICAGFVGFWMVRLVSSFL
jgi:hypothetical protein